MLPAIHASAAAAASLTAQATDSTPTALVDVVGAQDGASAQVQKAATLDLSAKSADAALSDLALSPNGSERGFADLCGRFAFSATKKELSSRVRKMERMKWIHAFSLLKKVGLQDNAVAMYAVGLRNLAPVDAATELLSLVHVMPNETCLDTLAFWSRDYIQSIEEDVAEVGNQIVAKLLDKAEQLKCADKMKDFIASVT